MSEFHNILLIKMSSLGDVMHGLPTACALRQRFPAAKLSWLIDARYAALLRGHPCLDEVIAVAGPTLRLPMRLQHIARASLQYRVAPLLRRAKFDLVIDMQGLLRTGLLAASTGARRRIGFANAREGATLFYTETVEAPWEMHAVLRNLKLAEALGANADIRYELHPRADLPPELRIDRSIVVAPVSAREAKNWPAEKYAELIRRIAQELGLRSILAGTAADLPTRLHIAQLAGAGAIVPPKIGLDGLIALISRSHGLIANDSGPLHVAVALDRPIVGIFGPTDPSQTGPFGRETSVVRESENCRPCQSFRTGRAARSLRFRHTCLTDLSVDRVMQTVRATFSA